MSLARYGLLPTPPSDDSVASSVGGEAPLAVAFDALAEGTLAPYAWSFGNDRTSGESSPTHVYTDAGTYSVMLTVEFANHEPAALITKRFVTAGEPTRRASPYHLYRVTEEGSASKHGTCTGGEALQLGGQWSSRQHGCRVPEDPQDDEPVGRRADRCHGAR